MSIFRRGAVIDAGLTVGVVAGLWITVTVASEPRSRPVDAGAYLLATLIALPILARRGWPLGTLVASAMLLFGYYASGYPGFSPAFALPVQLYFASLAGRWRWAVGIMVFFLLAGYVVIILLKHEPPLRTVNESLPQLALMTVTILFGEYVRRRRELAAETRRHLEQVERGREREAARRVAEERLCIARELHDTIAHSLATITVQAGSALHLLGAGDDGSRAALTAIRQTGKAALAEVRATLGTLRDGDSAETFAEHGLDRLPALLDAVRAAGLTVECAMGALPVLAPAADHAAYRILQESLTNVLRHAGAEATARVRLRGDSGELVVEVADDGPGCADPRGGHGLRGMRERAEAAGGTLTTGRPPGGGFLVAARLPYPAAPPEGVALPSTERTSLAASDGASSATERAS